MLHISGGIAFAMAPTHAYTHSPDDTNWHRQPSCNRIGVTDLDMFGVRCAMRVDVCIGQIDIHRNELWYDVFVEFLQQSVAVLVYTTA